MSDSDAPTARVSTTEISDLLAWCRRLTEQGPAGADPADLAAYQRAKADLLTRITGTRTGTGSGTGSEGEQR